MTSPFTPKTLSFLRSLKRNNDREWFRARKPQYDQHVRGPMIALIERLAIDFTKVAPGFVADPKISMYRIYRDTRFSADKSPLKTHVAAHFPARGATRGEGGGLYVEVAPGWVWIGGGLYMPSSPHLAAIRAQIASTHPRLHKIVTAPAFKRAVGEMTGDQMTRVPRGYAADHPAAHYLRFRRFLGGAEYPAAFATDRHFYAELCRVFTAVAPLVTFLNTALATEPDPATVTGARSPRGRTRTSAHPPVPKPMW
jgi:uncharacterized protein (TIGR02453 family)